MDTMLGFRRFSSPRSCIAVNWKLKMAAIFILTNLFWFYSYSRYVMTCTMSTNTAGSELTIKMNENVPRVEVVVGDEKTLLTINPPSPLLGAQLRRPRLYSRAVNTRGVVIKSGQLIETPSVLITSNLLHNFSAILLPQLRQHFVDFKFDDANRKMFLISPSCVPLKNRRLDERIHCLMRLWTDKGENLNDERFSQQSNRFQESYVFQQSFSADLEPVGQLTLLPVIAPTQYLIGGGLSDPRISYFGTSLVASVYTSISIKEETYGRTFFYNFTSRRLSKPKIEGFPFWWVESNWAMWNLGTFFNAVYTWNPLRLITCEGNDCQFAVAEETIKEKPPVISNLVLRGGTPVIHFRDDFYLTLLHSRHYIPINPANVTEGETSVYKFYVAFAKASSNKDACLVYISAGIELNKELLQLDKAPRPKSIIAEPFFYPLSIFALADGCHAVTGHLNDNSAVVLRLCGIDGIFSAMIAQLQPEYTCPSFQTTLNQAERLDNWLRAN